MKFILLYLMMISTVLAETLNADKKWGIGGGAGWTLPVIDNNFNEEASDGFTYGFHARYLLSPKNSVLLNFSHHNWGDTYVDANVVDLIYQQRTSPEERLSPVWGVGAGLADVDARDDSTSSFAAKLRGGVEYAVTDSLTASALVDLQYIPTDIAQVDEIYAVAPTVNLTWFFDAPKVPGIASNERKDRRDSDMDNDGVANANDKCSDTSGGVYVNDSGCPVPRFSRTESAGSPEAQAETEKVADKSAKTESRTEEARNQMNTVGKGSVGQEVAGKTAGAESSTSTSAGAGSTAQEATGGAAGKMEQSSKAGAAAVIVAVPAKPAAVTAVPAQEQRESAWYENIGSSFLWIVLAIIALLGLFAFASKKRSKNTRV